MKRMTNLIAALVLALGAASACEQGAQRRVVPLQSPMPSPASLTPEAQMVPASAPFEPRGLVTTTQNTGNVQAIDSIGRAWCAREARCADASSFHESYADCVRLVTVGLVRHIGTQACHDGIRSQELSHCTREIGVASCADDVSVFQPNGTCSSESLCAPD